MFINIVYVVNEVLHYFEGHGGSGWWLYKVSDLGPNRTECFLHVAKHKAHHTAFFVEAYTFSKKGSLLRGY